MPKFNKKVAAKTTVNLAGGKAVSMNAEQELIHAVLTTFLEDKFYETGNDRLNRIVSLCTQVKPQFLANLAVIARTEFNLRSVSHVLIGELSKLHKGDSLVKDTIVAAAVRPDDLLEIVSYLGAPLSKQVKRGVRNAILHFSPYQLAKYKGEGKAVSMVDLFNLTHPKPQHATETQKAAWAALMNGELKTFDTWEADVSNAADDEARKTAFETLIKENKMGYMALLRNLNNLVKYGVSEEVEDLAVAKLTDAEEVKRSKQLPFRFSTAFANVQNKRKFSDAISLAMDLAVANTPELSGNILIAVDSSGSMSSPRGDAKQSPMEIASIFGATLLKANVNADLITYDTKVKQLNLSGRTPVIDLADLIKKAALGGGTETSLVFAFAEQAKKKYDRIIIISDNESWSESWRGDSVQKTYTAFKKNTSSDPFVYAIDIEGYGTKDVDGGKVFHLTGWSDRLLDFIGRVEEGDTLIKYVRNFVLPAPRVYKDAEGIEE